MAFLSLTLNCTTVTPSDLVPSQRFLQDIAANRGQAAGLENCGRIFQPKGTTHCVMIASGRKVLVELPFFRVNRRNRCRRPSGNLRNKDRACRPKANSIATTTRRSQEWLRDSSAV